MIFNLKQNKLLILTLSLFLSGCFAQEKNDLIFNKVKENTKNVFVNKTIKIASFNIEKFGQSKAKKTKVMDIITKIVKRFDIVAIQEIVEKTHTAINNLIKKLGHNYAYIIGKRQGRKSSRGQNEQYAYVYNKKFIRLINKRSYTYKDVDNVFERKPYLAQFKALKGNFTFVLINIHIKPKDVLNEINELDNVIYNAQGKFINEDDFIVLGDMNADCHFFDEDREIDLRANKFRWLITNEMNTTVAKSKCTYDRIIATRGIDTDYTGVSGVFRFDRVYNLTHKFTKKVSDHYPVFAEFYVGRD